MRKIIYLKAKQARKTERKRLVSVGLLSSGLLLIFLAFWPIIHFNVMISPKFATLIKPVPDSFLIKNTAKQSFTYPVSRQNGVVVEAKDNPNQDQSDFSRASVWFPKKPPLNITWEESGSYTLSIPKLKILNAQVIFGNDDLNKSLVHYGGTAQPGNYGNTVIFGHSVLPYFFNPKDYKTIFSTLPSLSEGDEILVDYEGISYRYEVEEMRVVDPNDVSILEQTFDDSYLSLITCVPPGTYEKRLWVKSRIKKI